MKKNKYLIKIIIISIILQLAILPVTSNAVETDVPAETGAEETDGTEESESSLNLDNIFKFGSNWIEKGGEGAVQADETKPVDEEGNAELKVIIDDNEIRQTAGNIFNTLLAIGIALSVIIGGIMGIQFMMASAEEKAKIKETMIPYVIGCIVIFGAVGIWRVTVEILNRL